jgi:hypothetical protein
MKNLTNEAIGKIGGLLALYRIGELSGKIDQ